MSAPVKALYVTGALFGVWVCATLISLPSAPPLESMWFGVGATSYVAGACFVLFCVGRLITGGRK